MKKMLQKSALQVYQDSGSLFSKGSTGCTLKWCLRVKRREAVHFPVMAVYNVNSPNTPNQFR